jgi:hypothetical protein
MPLAAARDRSLAPGGPLLLSLASLPQKQVERSIAETANARFQAPKPEALTDDQLFFVDEVGRPESSSARAPPPAAAAAAFAACSRLCATGPTPRP